MKSLSLFISLLLFLNLTFAQVRELEPLIGSGTDISPAALASFEKNKAEYLEIQKSGIPYKDLSPENQALVEDEMVYETGPFFSGTWGCSWYCFIA